LVWPAVVLLCTRRGLYRACMVCIAIGFAARVLLLHFHLSVFSFTLTRLDGLAVGAWIAIFVRSPTGMARIKTLKPLWIFLGGLAVLAPLWFFEGGHAGFTAEVFKYFLVAVFYGSMLLCVLDITHPRIGKSMSNRALTTLGKYSYGLYVWDSIVQGWLHPWLSREALAPFVGNKYLLMASCMCIQFVTTFLAALLSWHLFEKHFLKLKRFFRYGEDRAASETIAPATAAESA
jgi:peptidoglycan/LPS O-acetylase OafA/YrhL